MTDVRFPSIEDYDDPDAKNRYHQMILEGGLSGGCLGPGQIGEPGQRPHPPCSGTTPPTGALPPAPPGLKVNPNYKGINAAAQRQDPHSGVPLL